MITFTSFFLTYLGMFIFLETHTTTVQNLTVSSEGPIREVGKISNFFQRCCFKWANKTEMQIYEIFSISCHSEMYSNLMGNYRIMEDTEQNGLPVYKHLEAEKFILYSSGKRRINSIRLGFFTT